MKVAFIHDHVFYQDKEDVFSRGGLPYNVLKRYTDIFENLIVMGRREQIIDSKSNKLVLSSGERIDFKLHNTYKTPIQLVTEYNAVKEPITEVIKEVDACIIRLPSALGILAVRECIKQDKPWMIEVVGCAWDALWHYGNLKGKILAPIMYMFNKYYIEKARYAIYVSQNFLQKRYPSKGTTINASNVNIQSVNEEVLIKRLKRIEDNIVQIVNLGIVGSLDVEYKGHRSAIYAVSELKKQGYKVKLKCLGSGEKEKWEQLCVALNVEKEIEFNGILPAGQHVLDWMDDIDILLIPSLTEGLPRALIEAMSRGCPAIGSSVGGIPELLDEKVLFKPKKYKELTNCIKILIDDERLLKKQSKKNFETAKEYYSEVIDDRRKRLLTKFKDSVE